MSTLFPKTITYTAVTFTRVNGKVSKVNTPGTFTGSVQPLSGKELDVVDVGRADLGKVKIYSNTVLKVAIEGSNTPGDVVQWQGRKWEVIAAMEYQNDLINHYKYIGEYREQV